MYFCENSVLCPRGKGDLLFLPRTFSVPANVSKDGGIINFKSDLSVHSEILKEMNVNTVLAFYGMNRYIAGK